MFITTFRFGDVFALTDAQGRTVATLTLRQRKGQNQIGIEAPGLKITKREESQDEENHGNSNQRQ